MTYFCQKVLSHFECVQKMNTVAKRFMIQQDNEFMFEVKKFASKISLQKVDYGV